MGNRRAIEEDHWLKRFALFGMPLMLLPWEALAAASQTTGQRRGIEAIYRKKNTSRPQPEHTVYPYRLRHLTIDQPNQVWAADITYLPMARGFVYLEAVIATPPRTASREDVECWREIKRRDISGSR